MPKEFVDGSLGGRFVSFTPKFKYRGTYLSQSLTEDINIDARILTATKNFNALSRIGSQLYLAIMVNILLWGCDSWALKKNQMEKLSCFHKKCLRQLCGYTMFLLKEHHIKTKVCMKKMNLKPIETYITIRQLRFLMRIAEMPENRLTRQVVNSQVVSQGKCSRGQQTTKRAYGRLETRRLV